MQLIREQKNENIDESLLSLDLASISDESREEYLDRYEGNYVRNIKYH